MGSMYPWCARTAEPIHLPRFILC